MFVTINFYITHKRYDQKGIELSNAAPNLRGKAYKDNYKNSLNGIIFTWHEQWIDVLLGREPSSLNVTWKIDMNINSTNAGVTKYEK